MNPIYLRKERTTEPHTLRQPAPLVERQLLLERIAAGHDRDRPLPGAGAEPGEEPPLGLVVDRLIEEVHRGQRQPERGVRQVLAAEGQPQQAERLRDAPRLRDARGG